MIKNCNIIAAKYIEIETINLKTLAYKKKKKIENVGAKIIAYMHNKIHKKKLNASVSTTTKS